VSEIDMHGMTLNQYADKLFERATQMVNSADSALAVQASLIIRWLATKLYAAPVPTGDVLLSVDGKTYASPSVSELASGVPIPVANLKELSTIPAGDAVSVRADVIAFLHGESPLEGHWYGESWPPLEGKFWWRKYLPESK
jgi:hypothetical protein